MLKNLSGFIIYFSNRTVMLANQLKEMKISRDNCPMK